MFITGTPNTKNLPALLTIMGFQKTLIDIVQVESVFSVIFSDLAIKNNTREDL